MTYQELTRDVLSLCRKSAVGSKRLMAGSANRALRDLYSRRKILRTVRLYAAGLTPALYYKQLYCQSGNTIRVPLQGKAYSMRLLGEGIYRIVDGGKTSITQFNTAGEAKLVRGRIESGGDIYFYGESSFLVFDMSVFTETLSGMLDNLPEGGQNQIFDIRALFGDFYSFLGPARDGDGRNIKGCRLYDGKLELPLDFRGEVNLTYRVLPPEVVIAYDEFDVLEAEEGEEFEKEDLSAIEIDIPGEYCHLVALLTAYYYLYDEKPIMAEALRAEYERMMSELERRGYEEIDSAYHLEIGWA